MVERKEGAHTRQELGDDVGRHIGHDREPLLRGTFA